MKTLICLYNAFENQTEFYRVDGDYRHLNGTRLIACGDSKEILELNQLLWNEDGTKKQVQLMTPLYICSCESTQVIECYLE